MNSRFLRWGIALAACVCVLVQPAAGATLSPEVARGLAWLQAQIKADGGVTGEARSVASVDQVRSEVATTLSLLSSSAPDKLLNLMATASPLATELLARKAIALQSAGRPADAVLAELAASQNADGGYGGEPGFASNALDTAWALQALGVGGDIHRLAASRALDWLARAQNTTGYWNAVDGSNAEIITAIAAYALWTCRFEFNVGTPVDKARAWLGTQRLSGGGWGGVQNTAQVLPALLTGMTDTQAVRRELEILIASQEAGGSWGSDPYITALALRALGFAVQTTPNPDLSSISGQLIDSKTRLPLSSVAVMVHGSVASVSRQTDAVGGFVFAALNSGAYTLEVPAHSDYKPLLADVFLSVGQNFDAGTILLNTNDNPTTATIVGRVTRADTGAALSGVIINAGPFEAITGADGSFQITQVAPGGLTITASSVGYRAVIGEATAVAGGTIIFSPVLPVIHKGDDPSGAISGLVTDALTGLPLANTSVAVGGAFSASTATDQQGKFVISPISATGEITISTALSGYLSASGKLVVSAGTKADFSPKLIKMGGAVNAGKVFGKVTDASTGLPVIGASIAVGSRTITTDSAGLYILNDVQPGQVRVVASAAGYAGAAAEGTMVANGVMSFSPALQVETQAIAAAVIFGTVKSAKSGALIAGAEVYVSGAKNYSAITAADGTYHIAPVNAGNYSVTVSYADYVAAQVNFDLPAKTEMAFSPELSEVDSGSVIVPNSASLSGRVLDSMTGKPVANAVFVVGGQSRERGVNRFGRFSVSGITEPSITATFSSPGYRDLSAQFPVAPLVQQDIGDLYIDRIVAARLPDLAVAKFDVSGVTTDPDSLIVSGKVAVSIANQGAVDTAHDLSMLVFEDIDQNGAFDAAADLVLGRGLIRGGVRVGDTKGIFIDVDGVLRYRDSPLRLLIDSDHAVLELDKANNIDLYGTSPNFSGKVYAKRAEFDQGFSVNVRVDGSGEALQLADDSRSFDNIWIANSGRGTVLKVDVNTGKVLGEYRSAPDGMSKNPSRTTVDKNGNVWVANRDESGYVQASAIAPGLPPVARGMGSILKIGLLENGQCEDRNGNGVIDTSSGLGDVRDWANGGSANSLGGVSTAQDECVLEYVRVNSTGTRHISVNRKNQVWVSGIGGRNFDLVSEDGQIIRQESGVGFGGYGGLIDSNDVIWSSTNGSLLRWDTQNPLTGPSGGNWQGINRGSYGLCIDSHNNVWDSRGSVYRPDGTLLRTYTGGSQGCAVDFDDNVWVANGSAVSRFRNDGTYVGQISTGSTGGTTGLSVDSNGMMWAVGGSTYVRIDPRGGPLGADGVTPVGVISHTGPALGSSSLLYNYSDMTGSTLSGKPQQGTWSAVYDSGSPTTAWGMVSWHAQILGDGKLSVHASSSVDCATYAAPVVVVSGQALTNVPAGRCLKVSAHFKRASTDESPVLYDLTVRPAVPDLTVARIRAVDGGGGASTLEALVGNASPFPAGAVSVKFWQGNPASGGVELGSASLAGLGADQSTMVRLPVTGVALGTLVAVHADSGNVYAEYNELNNLTSGPLQAKNQLAALVVGSDKGAYFSASPVVFDVTATNEGSFPGRFKLHLSVRDSGGDVTTEFPETTLGELQSAASVRQAQGWNTGSVLPGAYVVHGELFDMHDNLVASAQAPFEIIAGTNTAAATIATALSTDRRLYAPGQVVGIHSRVTNISGNVAFAGLTVEIVVRDNRGVQVWSVNRSLPQLVASGLRELSFDYPLSGAEIGLYTVTQTTRDAEGVLLDTRSVNFRVAATVDTGLGLVGQISASPNQIKPGERTQLNFSLRNMGNGSLSKLPIRVKLVKIGSGFKTTAVASNRKSAMAASPISEAASYSHTVDLPMQASVPLSDQWLAKGSIGDIYAAVLVAEVNGEEILLAEDTLVLADAAAVTPYVPASPKPVPTLSDFALLMLAALLGLMAWARRPARG